MTIKYLITNVLLDKYFTVYSTSASFTEIYSVSFTEDCNTAMIFVTDLDGFMDFGATNVVNHLDKAFIRVDLTK